MKQEMAGWQWHQLDHMQITCTSLQTDNHASTSSHIFYTPDALPYAQLTVSKNWRQATANQYRFRFFVHWHSGLGERAHGKQEVCFTNLTGSLPGEWAEFWVTRTQNVTEYMLVFAVCLVNIVLGFRLTSSRKEMCTSLSSEILK